MAEVNFKRTGSKRLLKLADFIAELPRNKKLDMTTVADEAEDGRPKCGTAACAMGWATAIPSFRRAGLYLDECLDVQIEGEARANIYSLTASRFFGIGQFEATTIFGSQLANNRRTVADRIRRFVARKLAA